MSVKLLTEQYLELLILKGGYTGSLSLPLSKCHFVGNHMSRLISFKDFSIFALVVILFGGVKMFRHYH